MSTPGAGDPPVAMAAGQALLVEVEIVGVAGVAGVSGPDLEAGAGIAGEDGGGEALVVGAVDVSRAGRACGGRRGSSARRAASVGTDAVAELVGRGDAVTLFDEVGVDEEVVEVGLGERLLDADAVEAGAAGASRRRIATG